MSARKNAQGLFMVALMVLPVCAFSAIPPDSSRQPSQLSHNEFTSVPPDTSPLTPVLPQSLEEQLGWMHTEENYCGGYYLDLPFYFPKPGQNTIETYGNQGLFALHGTSVIEGKVTINRQEQQVTTNKAMLYRDPDTNKITSVDLIGNVHLREPNTLIVAKTGRYDFNTNYKSLLDIYYRSTLSNNQLIVRPKISHAEMQAPRKITALTAWGRANRFTQTEPRIYEMIDATYSTCPPADPAWQVHASHIVLNKNTGRGYATHARIYIRNIPIFYFPYINFPIDNRRKSGFLWPRFGTSNTWGPYLLTPYYWNMAPNYDMTITPGILGMRGLQLTDNFRYLSHINRGDLNLNILPYDRHFQGFKENIANNYKRFYPLSGNPNITMAELARLQNSSAFRRGFFWRDDAQFNSEWSSHVDFNYVSDDYYLRDLGSGLNEITQNQLLQEADLYFKSEHWNVTGRLQGYQTLHPINSINVINQYRRLPQLIINGSYPDQALGLDYFVNGEAAYFDILKNPGLQDTPPLGTRFHLQPGLSLPLYWPAFYVSPRFQMAFTQYDLHQTGFSNTPISTYTPHLPSGISRAVPIFDVSSGLSFDRSFTLFSRSFQQTLEPQIYYTYIPFHSQKDIPLFDTAYNTLTYDQLFNYNRFTGIDRIGDANQLSAGIATRFIDSDTGLEKMRLAVGDIIYFTDRRVTLCQNGQGCTDDPNNAQNHYRLSPVSATLDYHVNLSWSLTNNNLWNPTTKQLDSSSITFHYQPDPERIINLGFSYVRNGDPFTGIGTNTTQSNLKSTDISFAWPLVYHISAVGRWTEDWNTSNIQNLLFGLQYDTCCWAVRGVGGETFLKMNQKHKPDYNKEFYLQVALKGFGETGTGDPTKLLNTITGYTTKFGQERL